MSVGNGGPEKQEMDTDTSGTTGNTNTPIEYLAFYHLAKSQTAYVYVIRAITHRAVIRAICFTEPRQTTHETGIKRDVDIYSVTNRNSQKKM